ncbi:MAG: MBL fold metallo-hydrolase [Deltaproteobacteria bacterium]|nr:MBL fold metallo-hydrolase [Deltaproteobacteria bacterium]
MQVRILASGSAGNLTLFETEDFVLLVDAGLDPGSLRSRLRSVGASYRAPDALIVTHAHADHAAHALAYAQREGIVTYVTDATARALDFPHDALVRRYSPRELLMLGPLQIQPCPLPHDAPQVALRVSDGEHAAVLATDLGEIPPGLVELIDESVCALLIESNHDELMLARGPYSSFLKRRVGSWRGHLSNAQTHTLLRAIPDSVATVVLMHLSEKNNRPEIALETASDALSARSTRLLAARQYDHLLLDLSAPWQALSPRPERPAQR